MTIAAPMATPRTAPRRLLIRTPMAELQQITARQIDKCQMGMTGASPSGTARSVIAASKRRSENCHRLASLGLFISSGKVTQEDADQFTFTVRHL